MFCRSYSRTSLVSRVWGLTLAGIVNLQAPLFYLRLVVGVAGHEIATKRKVLIRGYSDALPGGGGGLRRSGLG